MAFAATSIWELQTGGNDSNGGGFNPGNVNMATDGVVTSANTSTPVVSSPSYNFQARDVGNWYFQGAGANVYPGWYKIVSVASNAATLNAAAGQWVAYTANQPLTPGTVNGCASVASPTGITWSVDYSQSTAIAYTDLVAPSTTTITSAAKPMGKNFVGNIIRPSSGTGWNVVRAEIISVTGTTATVGNFSSGTTIATAASTGGVANIGGPVLTFGILMSLMNTAGGNQGYGKSGTYTFSSTSSNVAGGTGTLNVAGTRTAPNRITGYGTVRGDDVAAPRFLVPASGVTTVNLFAAYADYTIIKNLWFDGASKTGIRAIDLLGLACQVNKCAFDNCAAGAVVAESGCKGCTIRDSIFSGCSGTFYCITVLGANPTNVFGCTFVSCTVAACEIQAPGSIIEDCIVNACAGSVALNAAGAIARNISVYGSTAWGLFCYTAADSAIIENCYIEGSSTWGYQLQAANATVRLTNCGGYNNTSGNYSTGFSAANVTNFKTLTTTAFTNAGGSDFSLNSVVTGGGLLRAGGTPSYMNGTYSYPDIGAVQHADPVSLLVHGGMTGGMRG